MKKKLNFRIPFMFALVVAFATFVGFRYAQKEHPQKETDPKDKIEEILRLINKDYVDEPDKKRITDAAITAMLKELDPHSVYIPVSEVKAANEGLEGNFEGIGVEFNILNDTIIVVSPISGGPSEQLGIRSGDKIIKIDGKKVAGVGFKNEDVFKNLRGKKGTQVKVSIYRSGEAQLIDFVITRDKIPIYSIDASYMAEPGIGYIKINRFSGTTMDEFRSAMTKLRGQGMKDLILDLRGNPGGYLNAAKDLADEFLSRGKMIVYTEGRSFPRQEYKSTAMGSFEQGKLAVLIDEGSASASEIVSGALQDCDRAIVIGRRSFGKGLVQEPYTLQDGSQVRLTIARYYTPSGRNIQRSYKKGYEDYSEDQERRIEKGELFNKDSIKLDTSKVYHTIAGRTVYGGGGIMPDIFIPLDTTESSSYLNRLANKGAFNEFVLSYTDKHRTALNAYKSFEDFNKHFEVTADMMKDFTEYGEKKGVKKDAKGYNRSADYIKVELKALFARELFHNDGFYEVLNRKNSAYLKALQVFHDNTFDKLKLQYK